MHAEQRFDHETRTRLGAIELGYRGFARKVWIILAFLAATQLVLGVLSVYLIGQRNAVVDRIQFERERNIRESCEGQNDRNQATKDEIRQLTPPGTHPDRLKVTFVIVDRLQPRRDCDKVVARSVGNSGGDRDTESP